MDADFVLIDDEWVLADDVEGSGEFFSALQEELKIQFFEPALFWTEALPVGNGKLGAMVFGGVESELLHLNEDSLWSGGPRDWNNPRAAELLPQVRSLVSGGRYAEASALSRQMLGPYAQVYQPLADLRLTFEHRGYDASSYCRDLDLHRALVSTVYHVDATSFTREVFCSGVHQVLVVRISTSSKSALSFQMNLDSQLREIRRDLGVDRYILQGRCPGHVPDPGSYGPCTGEGGNDLSKTRELGMAFAAILEVRVSEGGHIRVDNDYTLRVETADWAVLLIAAASSFAGPLQDPVDAGRDPVAASLEVLNALHGVSFDEILSSHLADYQPLFRRVCLCLSKSSILMPSMDKAPAGTERLQTRKASTKERIQAFNQNEDPALVVLLFQFGRYLLLASSRPGSFVANLQGLWNKDLLPSWRCVPHLNINLEMNYWPAETCNLSECHEPLLDLVSSLAIAGSTTAKVNYGMSGWVCHHNADIWAQTAPVGGDPVWALWPMGGAWLSLHVWEHYAFSLDKSFLERRAYPLLKSCSEFLLDWLMEDGKGHLVTNPSTSPEHYFMAPSGEKACVTYATAMDMAIIWEVFTAVTSAAQELPNTDDHFVGRVRDAQQRLLRPKIGENGLLLEWPEEYGDTEEHHRHMSHLFGLFPGHSITLDSSPELCKAAVQSVIKRGQAGPGWSMAWKVALWARLREADRAFSMVKRMYKLIDAAETRELYDGGGLYANLFNAHPPFQIDGNFGFTAGIAEMLLQSDRFYIHLLPALPRVWRSGHVSGLRARGAATVAMSWENGVLLEVTLDIQDLGSREREIRYLSRKVSLAVKGPGKYTLDGRLRFVKTKSSITAALKMEKLKLGTKSCTQCPYQ